MSFSSLLELLKQQREIPVGVSVPRADIQLGRVSGKSTAALRLQAEPQSTELSTEQLNDLAQR